jgi:hypothetical protein
MSLRVSQPVVVSVVDGHSQNLFHHFFLFFSPPELALEAAFVHQILNHQFVLFFSQPELALEADLVHQIQIQNFVCASQLVIVSLLPECLLSLKDDLLLLL